MTFSEQFCLLPESAHEGGSSLHRAQVAPCTNGEITKIPSAVVGRGVVLEIAPDAFDGVHLRSVSRQELQGDSPVLGIDVLANELRAVRLQAVPDDQQLLLDGRLQHLE